MYHVPEPLYHESIAPQAASLNKDFEIISVLQFSTLGTSFEVLKFFFIFLVNII